MNYFHLYFSLYLVTPSIAFPVSGTTFTVNESSIITIQCSATGIPYPTLSWYRESVLLSSQGGFGINDRITISDLMIEDYLTPSGIIKRVNQTLSLTANGSDTGSFMCTADNNVLVNASVDFNVFVQGKHVPKKEKTKI